MMWMTGCCMLRDNVGCNDTMSWGELLGKVHMWNNTLSFTSNFSKYQTIPKCYIDVSCVQWIFKINTQDITNQLILEIHKLIFMNFCLCQFFS